MLNGYLKPVGALGKGATGIVFLAIATTSPPPSSSPPHHHHHHHHHHHRSSILGPAPTDSSHAFNSPRKDHEFLSTAMEEMCSTVDMDTAEDRFPSKEAAMAVPPSPDEMHFGVKTDGEDQFDLKGTSKSESKSRSAVSASMEEIDDGSDRIPSKANHAIASRGSCCAADNLFALKAFRRSRDEDLERSRNEEQVLSSLAPHPFLPRLHSAFDFADFRFLVLDFCAGGDLASLARSLPRRRFSPHAIRYIYMFFIFFISSFLPSFHPIALICPTTYFDLQFHFKNVDSML